MSGVMGKGVRSEGGSGVGGGGGHDAGRPTPAEGQAAERFAGMAWWPLILLATVPLWVAIAARANTALPHDMAEQFVWAQTWQWGYPKHPPLPTWLFKLLLTVVPVSPGALYTLAALCIGATGGFTYLLTREIAGPRLALCALALWTLQQPFSWRAWMYNHNSALVMCVALAAWGVAKLLRTGQLRWWGLVAVASGLAMLCKFQAALPLLGLLWVMWRAGGLARPDARWGVPLVIATTALMLSPNLWWMFHGHAGSLDYARHQLGEGCCVEHHRLFLFLLVNLRMLVLVLLVLLGWVLYAVRRGAGAGQGPTGPADASAWMEGLVLIPVIGVSLVGLSGGATVPGHWGVQTFQFVALALVLAFAGKLRRLPMPRAVWPVLALHLVSMAVAVSPAMSRLHASGTVQGYPAAELAHRIDADWRRQIGCPLRYVQAPFFEGGQIAAMVPGFPAIFEDGDLGKSPWIDTADMARRGYVVVVHERDQLPPQARHDEGMVLRSPATNPELHDVYWGIVPPAVPCQTARP